MKRRVVAAVAAVVLAAVGGLLLLGYVGAADERAMADLEPVTVLVATKPVPEGTTAEDLGASVEVRRLPGVAVAPGTAAALADLRGLVTTTTLQPGEQLLRSRFADPAALKADQGLVVPKGLQQVSVQLEPERALNGNLAPGATVGVFLSTTEVETTALALHRVLVTAVHGGAAAPAATEGDADAESTTDAKSTSAPTAVTVTLAVTADQASRLVFAAEHGSVWLSADPSDAPTDRLPVITKKSLYR